MVFPFLSLFFFFFFFFYCSERVHRFARSLGARSPLLSIEPASLGSLHRHLTFAYLEVGILSPTMHCAPVPGCIRGRRTASRQQASAAILTDTGKRKNDNNGSRAAPVAGISTGRFIVSPHRSTFSLSFSLVRRLRFPRRVGGFRLPIPQRGVASPLSMVNSLTQPLMIHRWLFSFSLFFFFFLFFFF